MDIPFPIVGEWYTWGHGAICGYAIAASEVKRILDVCVSVSMQVPQIKVHVILCYTDCILHSSQREITPNNTSRTFGIQSLTHTENRNIWGVA